VLAFLSFTHLHSPPMAAPNPSELTADEVTLLVVAARLAALVKEYAELPPLTEEIQFFWDGKIGREEMVRCA
jgi:hypothetical protein